MAKKDYKSIESDQKTFDKFVYNFAMQALRRATYRWPFRNIALQNARIERGFYKCESCQGVFGPKEVQKDHIEPVIPTTGFDNWDNTIKRLLVKTSGWQVICLACHSSKTLVENEMRKKNGLKPLRVKKSLTKKKIRAKLK